MQTTEGDRQGNVSLAGDLYRSGTMMTTGTITARKNLVWLPLLAGSHWSDAAIPPKIAAPSTIGRELFSMQTLVEQIVYISDMFGTAVFAFSGVLVAGRLRMDGFGVMVLAAVTAIGGGTIRDMILGATPVFWVRDPLYIWVVIATALIGMWMVKLPRRMPWYVLPVADAFGLALFTVIGAQKALNFGTSG